jgi:ABC-2 type transport system permease protein
MFKKYLTLVHLYTINALQYKAYGLVYTLFDLVPTVILLFYWHQAFATTTTIGAYSHQQLVSYFLVVGLVRIIVISYPEHSLQQQLNSGEFSNFLLKPFSYVRLAFIGEATFKINRLINAIPTFALLVLMTTKVLHIRPQLSLSPTLFIILILSFIITFLMKISIGLLAIWTSEISWIVNLNELITLVLSGAALPLSFFPTWFQTLSHFLPFQFITHIPALVIENSLTLKDQLVTILTQLVWVSLLGIASQAMWQKSLTHYAAYGR